MSQPSLSARQRVAVLVALIGLAATATAMAQVNQLGRWTPAAGTPDHMRVHMALLPGDSTYHSKVISWHYGQPLPIGLWGWNAGTTTAQNDCVTYPGSLFTPRPLGTGYPDLFCSGHSLLSNGDLLVAGGHQSANDIGLVQSILFRRNASTSEQWGPQGDMSQGRWYPTNTTLPDGNVLTFSGTRFWHMLVFGGTEAPLDPNSSPRDDINRLGLNLPGVWLPTVSKPPGSTSWPEPREGHTAVWHSKPNVNQMLVFGGRRGGVTTLNDVWRLHLGEPISQYKYEWFKITPIGLPPLARSRHSAVVLADGRLVIYGGRDSTGAALSDVWVMYLEANIWNWKEATVLGTGPGARYGHAAVPDTVSEYNRNRMLVYGGATTGGGVTNDKVFALTLTASSDTATWVEQTVSGSKPEARHGHTLVVDTTPSWGNPPSRRFLLFGGRTATTLKNDSWELMVKKSDGSVSWNAKSPTNPPPARTRHAALWDLTSDVPGHFDFDRMIVFGGEVSGGASNQAWALNDSCTAWTQLQTHPSFALAGQSAIYHPLRIWALDPELFSSSGGAGTWQAQNAPKRQPYYPFMFVLPSGNLFYAGSKDTTFLYKRVGVSPPVWEKLPATGVSPVFGGSAVSFRPGEVMKCGTEFDPSSKITAKIRIEANDTSIQGWQMSDTMTADTLRRRIYHNLTLLPTGDVLVTGGLRGRNADATEAANPSVKEAQIWYPYLGTGGRGKWSGALAADPARRGYHSTAMLLPDGRVISAGGENTSTNANWNRATMYCPPYLFDSTGTLATRPTIAGAPDSITYGTRFTICTPQAATVTSACLIAPGAVTHAFNQHQRYVPLPIIDRCGQQLIVGAPGDANNAPPGYYLLFIVNNGVPAVAKWAHVSGAPGLDECDTTAPAAVTDLLVTTGKTTAAVSWTAPGDDGYCGTAQEFDLRFSLTPITELSFYGAPRITTPAPGPPGTLHCIEESGLASCQWRFYAIKTRDDRNQWSAISNGASAQTKCFGSTEVMCEFGGLLAQGGTGGGWAPENSLFWESPGSQAVDLYRLRGPSLEAEPHRLRLAKIGNGRADLDHVRLGAVDHEAGIGAFAAGDRVFVGATAPVLTVTDEAGIDVTSCVDGSSAHPFLGTAGRSLRVVLASGGSSQLALVVESSGYRAGLAAESTGVLVQRPDGVGWKTISHLYPRRGPDHRAVETEGSAVVRLLFLGEHEIRSVRRLAIARSEDPLWLDLLNAQHSRLGNVSGAVGSSGGTSTALLPGDDITLGFASTTAPAGQVRDLFLYVRGGYTGTPGVSQARATEEGRRRFEFALGPARPSPSTGTIYIDYSLAVESDVHLHVYDIAGRRIRSLDLGRRDSGPHRATWDGRDDAGTSVNPGVYLYRMTTGHWQSQRKVVIAAR